MGGTLPPHAPSAKGLAPVSEHKAHSHDDVTRRDFIYVATSVAGAVGVAALAWPFIDQMNPSAAARALATTEVDLAPIEEGQTITIMWRGKPVFVRHRTPAEIADAEGAPIADLKDQEDLPADAQRVQSFEGQPQKQWLIVLASCTHLGCIPVKNLGDYKGWFCPCHGSHYDTAGRIRKGPAPKNLAIPPYQFVSATRVLIG